MRRCLGLTLLLALTAATLSRSSAPAAVRIVIGPNILVSRDGDIPHVETMIAASPTHLGNLLGGAIVFDRPDGGPADKPYFSPDGGETWTGVAPPGELRCRGADPQVGFGVTGTAYFVSLSPPCGMLFYRSIDGGATWGKPLSLRLADHEMLAVDHTSGPYAGRVYLTAESNVPGHKIRGPIWHSRVILYRSSDDGRSFVGPIEVARAHNTGLEAANPVVLSDGTLFIPMLEYPNYATDKTNAYREAEFSLSRDGGVTFSPVRSIGKMDFGGAAALPAVSEGTHPPR